MVRHLPSGRISITLAITLGILLLLTACSRDGDDIVEPRNNGPDTAFDASALQTIEGLVSMLRSGEQDQLRGQRLEIEAWITHPPSAGAISTTPPRGCPVVPEKQDWLTDDPQPTRFEVAGATLPNRLETEVSFLRLVVPYQLGFIDVPERARLRGRLLVSDYAECPRFESLFVLDEIVEELGANSASPDIIPPESWKQLEIPDSELLVDVPADWKIEENREAERLRVRFLSPEGHRPIVLSVLPGETYWRDGSTAAEQAPDVLRGDHVAAVSAGQALARLVDDSSRTGSGERELRIVFNHNGNTVTLSTVVTDGLQLDIETISMFSEFATRIRLQGEVAATDPMDPLMAASDELGSGPFLSEADAQYLSVGASGMTGANPVEAQLVSEREARMVTSGACREFVGNPDGVWLVTVEGTLPTGGTAFRLVYLDAVTGSRLCQTEVPGP